MCVYKCVHTIVCRYGWCSRCFRNKVCKTWSLWSSLHILLDIEQISWVSREKTRHRIAGGFIILSRYDKPSREKLLCIYSAQIPVKWHGAILIRPVRVSWRLAVHMRSFPRGAEPEAEIWMCGVNSILTVHWDPGRCITLYIVVTVLGMMVIMAPGDFHL